MSDPRPTKPRDDMPVRVHRLGAEAGDDLSAVTTAEERLEMVGRLSARMWMLTGRPIPCYRRSEMPGRVVRPR